MIKRPHKILLKKWSVKKAQACVKTIFASREALKSLAFNAPNFSAKIYVVLIFCLLFHQGKSEKENLTSTRGIYKAIEANFVQGNLSNVATLLSAFNPTTNIENNYKTYYSLLKNYTANGSLTLVEQLQLLILCHQCPFVDGAVVYEARALYNLVNETVVVYNDANCSKIGFSFRTTNDSSAITTPQETDLFNQLVINETFTKTKFKPLVEYNLYPNPAINEVAIISNTNSTEKLEVKITDVNGKLLISKTLITIDFRADLKLDLLNGIYFVNLINENGTKTVKKLVIAKY